ncbi:zinc finger protein ZFAT [Aplochiton taeniatus]
MNGSTAGVSMYMCRLCNCFTPSLSQLLSHCSQLHEDVAHLDDIIKTLKPLQAGPVDTVTESPVKRKRGRPKGSTKKKHCDLHVSEPGSDQSAGAPEEKENQSSEEERRRTEEEEEKQEQSLDCRKCQRSFSNRRQILKHVCLAALQEDEEEEEEEKELQSCSSAVSDDAARSVRVGGLAREVGQSRDQHGSKKLRLQRSQRGCVQKEPEPGGTKKPIISVVLADHEALPGATKIVPVEASAAEPTTSACETSIVEDGAASQAEQVAAPQDNAASQAAASPLNATAQPVGMKQGFQEHSIEQATNRLNQGQLKIFSCEYCNKIFKFRHSLQAHLRTHTQEKPFACPHCDYTSAIKANLSVHLRKHTGERFSCEHCSFRCISRGHLKVHVERVHLKVKQHCSFCKKKYSDIKNLLKHLQEHHDMSEDKVQQAYQELTLRTRQGKRQLLYHCPTCQRHFKNQLERDRHLQVHGTQRPFACQLCDHAYTKMSALQAHISKHLFLYICARCRGTFVSSAQLKAHLGEMHPDWDLAEAFPECICNSFCMLQPGDEVRMNALQPDETHIPQEQATSHTEGDETNAQEQTREEQEVETEDQRTTGLEGMENNTEPGGEAGTPDKKPLSTQTEGREMTEGAVSDETSDMSESGQSHQSTHTLRPENDHVREEESTHSSTYVQVLEPTADISIQGLHPTADSSIQGLDPPADPSIQELEPPVDPTIHGLEPPVDPSIQGLDTTADPSIHRLDPSADPSIQGLDPTVDPSGQGLEPSADPSGQGLEPPADPSIQGLEPPVDPSIQGLNSTVDPTIHGLEPPVDPSIQGLDPTVGTSIQRLEPPEDPSIQGLDPTVDPSIHGLEPPADPSIQGEDPTVGTSIQGLEPPEDPSIQGLEPPADPSIQGLDPTVDKVSVFEQIVNDLQKRPLDMEIFNKMRKLYGDLECEYCGKLFWYQVHYNLHVRTHTKEHVHYCSQCSYSSITKNCLTRHQLQKHSGLLLPCSAPGCTYATPDKYKLQAHAKTHQELGKKVACPVCQKMFTESRLKYHLRNSHPGASLASSKVLMVKRGSKCPYCDYYFMKNSTDLQQHIWAHQGVKPFKCSLCEYASRNKSNLNAHMNKHSSEKSHLCDLCGKKFKSKNTLKSHRLNHSAEGKQYKCSECDFTSVQKPSLLRHMEQHASFKPFRCAHCHYSCNNSGPLKRHYSRKHPGLEYSNAGPGEARGTLEQQGGMRCPVCEFVYGTKWEMNRHLKNKHGLKPSENAGIITWEVEENGMSIKECEQQEGAEAALQDLHFTGNGVVESSAVNILQQIIELSSENPNAVSSVVAMAQNTVTVEVNNRLMMVVPCHTSLSLQVAGEEEQGNPGEQVMVVEGAEGLDTLTVFTQGDDTHYIVYVQEQTVEIDQC